MAPTSLTGGSTLPVLVVDDDRGIRESLAAMLEDEGYSVLTAVHGEDAFRVLEERGAPGVILLDLTMPVMDGNTFLSVLIQHPRFSSVPVVVLSALGRPVAKGAVRILSKPLDFDAVMEVVQTHCGLVTRAA